MIVRCVSRAAKTRASSSSAAVPDSSAADPRALASRWAMITIGVPPLAPGALSDHRLERPLTVDRLRRKPPSPYLKAPVPGAAEPFQRVCHPRRERVIAASCRGVDGEIRATRLFSSANALSPSNASGASVEVSGSGRAVRRTPRPRGNQKRHETHAVEASVQHPRDLSPVLGLRGSTYPYMPLGIVLPRAPTRSRRPQDPLRLHPHLRQGADRRNPRARRATAGPARRAHLGDRLRWGRLGDPLHARRR